MSPPWAIAPCSDSPGLDLAGESEQSDERRLKTNAPFLDSAVAALAGQSEQSDERRLKTNAPFTDSTIVTIGDLRSTNAGHGSTLPSLRVSSASGGRDRPTASPSRVSTTSSQKHGAVAKPASMWNIRCRGLHPSVQASPPSCATVRDLPSPSHPPPPLPFRCPARNLGSAHSHPSRPTPSPPPGEPVRQRRIIPNLGVGPLMLSKIRLGREALEVRAGGATPDHPVSPVTPDHPMPSSPPQNAPALPVFPCRRHSIKTATNSINHQSSFNQVQSTTNQPQSIDNQEQSLFNHNLDPHLPGPPCPLIPPSPIMALKTPP